MISRLAGMHPDTGAPVTGLAHLRASVRNILATPVGSLVMHRDYGSLLPRLIDQPLNDATLLRAYAATVVAITRWEPRLRIRRIGKAVDRDHHGAATLILDAVTAEGDPVTLDVPLGGNPA